MLFTRSHAALAFALVENVGDKLLAGVLGPHVGKSKKFLTKSSAE